MVQIDHTEIDVIVVDEQTREPLSSRPWLTLAVDVFSRTVTCLHECAVARLGRPVSAAFGVRQIRLAQRTWDHQEWPVAGLPEALHVDNAPEFKSPAFVLGCENEGVKIIYRPPAQPHMGGHIERLIGTMMGAVHLLPGTTFSRPEKRGEYDSSNAARMTLRELESYLAIEITGSYHQRIHEGLRRAPIAVWREFGNSPPYRMPRDRMGFWVSFLPDEKRRLRPDGLHLFGLKYWHGALSRDLRRGDEKVLVRYDPRDISRVFVQRSSGAFLEVRWSDLTMPPVSLHEWRGELRERNKKARDERDTAAMMRAIAQKRQIVDQASRTTMKVRRGGVAPQRPEPDDDGYGMLRGVDSRIPVPEGRVGTLVALDAHHLNAATAELLWLSSEERIRAIQADRWAQYPRAWQALAILRHVLDHPRTTRMPSVAICGDSGMGKTMIMERFRLDHPPDFDPETGSAGIPVLGLQMSGKPSERRLYAQLLTALGAPHNPRATMADLEQKAIGLLRITQIKVLVIDEVHNLLCGSHRDQRVIMNILRFLSNELRMSLVCFGVMEAREATHGDVQLAWRFEAFTLPRWSANQEFEDLIRAALRNLPLRQPSVLTAKSRRHILQATQGLTAGIFTMLNALAIAAIENCREQITDDAVLQWTPLIRPEAAYS